MDKFEKMAADLADKAIALITAFNVVASVTIVVLWGTYFNP